MSKTPVSAYNMDGVNPPEIVRRISVNPVIVLCFVCCLVAMFIQEYQKQDLLEELSLAQSCTSAEIYESTHAHNEDYTQALESRIDKTRNLLEHMYNLKMSCTWPERFQKGSLDILNGRYDDYE